MKHQLQEQEAFSLKKGVIRKFCRSKVVVRGLDDMFDADLADMQEVIKHNDGIIYLLVVIEYSL